MIQPPASCDLESCNVYDNILTEETAGLLKVYQNGIGIWMDIFDHTHTYQNEIVRCALSSPLLMYSICAMSAKQISLTQNKFLWEPIASRFYGESLSLLITGLTDPSTERGLLLAATILLGSYELLAEPGTNYQRHIYGASTVIQSFKTGEREMRLEQASIWVYARQDVALALLNERPTLTPPDKWPPLPKHADFVDERFGNEILQLLAKVIQIKFAQRSCVSPNTKHEDLQQLLWEIESLWGNLPSHFRGTRIKTVVDDPEGLSTLWFCDPAAGAACLYYHMSKILILECLLEGAGEVEYTASIHSHAREITSICLFSDLPDGAMVVAVNPVFYAAKHIPSLALKTRLWGVLDKIETRLGFYTRDRQTQLQRELQK
ncbi:uncharacterized protein N7459_004230 [Penicillium hispanicum]|uniref:uncharacterized protein n=1 Tax=Penicillium hispanicum TaxID=1080232 RepID=UPI0025423511|nr:uncharacterized protein N7459_004230 [Penicillium hispanicum]KAJ5584430.1 hypothetical protein N7459_004230 [Penicillium hispanicum]